MKRGKRKKIIEIVSKHSDLKRKKWNQVLTDFEKAFDCSIKPDVLRNRWNLLTKQYKQAKLVKNSSGAGTISNEILPPEVTNDFGINKKNFIQNSDMFEALSDVLDNKIATGDAALTIQNAFDEPKYEIETPTRQKRKASSMDDFEKEMLAVLRQSNTA